MDPIKERLNRKERMIWLQIIGLFAIIAALTALSFFWPPINFFYAVILFIIGCFALIDIEEIRKERGTK